MKLKRINIYQIMDDRMLPEIHRHVEGPAYHAVVRSVFNPTRNILMFNIASFSKQHIRLTQT